MYQRQVAKWSAKRVRPTWLFVLGGIIGVGFASHRHNANVDQLARVL